jgi:aryl-alcohol dehydrogenase-like predicted oxidoreductase
MIGLTSHQRALAASWAQSVAGENAYHLDLLMIRYNAAHRGAERDVLPITAARGMPVVTFTGLRWRALLEPTPADPEGFDPPKAFELYRFCLAHPAVSVALMAPNDRQELELNLGLLDDWERPDESRHKAILDHGDRVREHAGTFW